MSERKTSKNIAVIGSGVAGLGASWALAKRHRVTIFERETRPGGHANTLIARLDGSDVSVDTGFIVFNTVNYPHLVRLFTALDVPNTPSDMSFAVSLHNGTWEMAGRLTGLFSSMKQFTSIDHWGLLADTVRFFREAETALDEIEAADECLGSWLDRHRYREPFIARLLVPMAAAIWSSSAARILDYPVRPFVRFFRNHGLLKFVGRIPWRTVQGGSRVYVERLLADMPGDFVVNTQIAEVEATSSGPCLVMADGNKQHFDAVIIATHADQAHDLLSNDTDRQRCKVLKAFSYQPNVSVLHTDRSLMPRRRHLWSSWNYGSQGDDTGNQPIALTYWMNRLQGIKTNDQVFVTLNPTIEPDPAKVFTSITYDHPQFDLAAIAAQEHLPRLQGRDGIWFCGSYTGNGFHEDALRSGLQVADALGSPAPWWTQEDRNLAPWTTKSLPVAEAI